MRRTGFAIGALLALCVAGCATTQSGFRPLGKPYPPRPTNFAVEIFETGEPQRAFERIARLDTHFEKTHLIYTSHETGMVELKKQARASGADAVIEVREMRSRVGETFVLHLTGIAIRYTD